MNFLLSKQSIQSLRDWVFAQRGNLLGLATPSQKQYAHESKEVATLGQEPDARNDAPTYCVIFQKSVFASQKLVRRTKSYNQSK